MDERFFDKNGNEIVLSAQVQNKINYRDYDYSHEKVSNVRQRLGILKKFDNRDLKIKYWNKLIATGKDSPGCFIEMIKNSRTIDFNFHNIDKNTEIEWNWVFRKLQVNQKHRIEMLPANVDLIDLVRDLNEIIYNNKVVFNIGQNHHLLNNVLYSMNNLIWLNLTNSELTNSKIHSIFQVMNRGKLQNLRGLIITNNVNVQFEELKKDLSDLTRGKLQYLETDLKDKLEGGKENKHLLEVINVGTEFKLMNDAKKLKYLSEIGIIENKDQDVLIDFGVCQENWGERVKLGLIDSYKGISYKVKLNKVDAKLRERVVSEKISSSMIRSNFITNLQPLVKKPRRLKPTKLNGRITK
jgi:hypothetical protein